MRISEIALSLLSESVKMDHGKTNGQPVPRGYGIDRLSTPLKEQLESRLEDMLAGGDGAYYPGVKDGVDGSWLEAGPSDELTQAENQKRFPLRKETDPSRRDLAGRPYPHPSQRDQPPLVPDSFHWPSPNLEYDGFRMLSVRAGNDPMPQLVEESLRQGLAPMVSIPRVGQHMVGPSGVPRSEDQDSAEQGMDPPQQHDPQLPIIDEPSTGGRTARLRVASSPPIAIVSNPNAPRGSAANPYQAVRVGWAKRRFNRVARIFGVSRSDYRQF